MGTRPTWRSPGHSSVAGGSLRRGRPQQEGAEAESPAAAQPEALVPVPAGCPSSGYDSLLFLIDRGLWPRAQEAARPPWEQERGEHAPPPPPPPCPVGRAVFPRGA